MERPKPSVISAKDTKKTLSFKPKKPVKVLRHVFAAPCERYWPLLDNEKEADLKYLLERTLVVARSKEKYPKKNLSKEERKKNRKSVDSSNDATDLATTPRSSLFLGLNAVSRALEKCETSVVLLAHDLDPPMLGHHVSDLCVVKRVPLIVTQSLRQATTESLGFSCIALGIKQGQTQFTELEEKLLQLSTNFPIPDGPMHKTVNDNVDDDIYDSDGSSVDEQPSKLIQEEWDPKRLEAIYLLRTSRKERIFNPKLSNPVPLPAKESLKFDSDFISFGRSNPQQSEEPSISSTERESEVYRVSTTLGIDETLYDTLETSSKLKRKISNYMPLIMKVVQSNPDKKKKKKEKFKQ